MRRRAQSFAPDQRGNAAVEMALVMPLVMALLFGAMEMGNYFWNEHILAKGLRDAAIYAARQPITNFDCSAAAPSVPPALQSDIQAVARTGLSSGGNDRLLNWDATTTTFTVTMTCVTSVSSSAASGTTALTGIYTQNTGGKVPVLTISASLPYHSLFGMAGFNAVNLKLVASEQAVVTGL